MRYVITLAALVLWFLAAPASALAQSAPAPSRPDEPRNLVLSLDAEHVKGEKGASLALVDFTDYQ